VRQALELLSDDEPEVAPGPAAARDDGHVPSSVPAVPPAAVSAAAGDEADTTPLPVIIVPAAGVRSPEEQEAPRGPFEPPRAVPPASSAAPARPDTPEDAAAATPDQTGQPAVPDPAESLSPAAAEKLDQIKDLLITAEAIGEANLDMHFDQVSRRQRELIREFFDKAIPGEEPKA